MRHLLVLLALLCPMAFADSGDIDEAQMESIVTRQFGLTKSDAKFSIRVAGYVRDDIKRGSYRAIATWADRAMDRIVAGTVKRMADHGQVEWANQKAEEWKTYSGSATAYLNSRHIGDHPSIFISQWLENFVDGAILVLGITASKMLHITDLKTLNSIKLIFMPCTFPMDSIDEIRQQEYKNHFAQDDGDETLDGEIPVITYWAMEATLMASGVGIAASPISSACEYIMATFLAPRLSDAIFNKAACTTEESW